MNRWAQFAGLVGTFLLLTGCSSINHWPYFKTPLAPTPVFTSTYSPQASPTSIETQAPIETPKVSATQIPPAQPHLSEYADLPVGLFIVYQGGPPAGLFVVSLDGQFQARLMGYNLGGQAISPDGRLIEYGAVEWKERAVLNLETNSLTPIRTGACTYYAISPVLDWLALDCSGRVCVAPADESEPTCLQAAPSDIEAFIKARWSPNGSWLALFKVMTGMVVSKDERPMKGLYLMDAICLSEPKSCAEALSGPYNPPDLWLRGPLVWSPDSRQIAALSEDGEGPILIFDLEAESFRRAPLPEGDGPISGLAWSPDGSWLAYSRKERAGGPTGIYLLNVSSGKVKSLINSSWDLEVISWLNKPDPNAPPPFFQLGIAFKVTEAGNLLNLRGWHTIWSEPVMKLKAGTDIMILEGPVEADDYIWWRVRVLPNGPEGWLVEKREWFTPE